MRKTYSTTERINQIGENETSEEKKHRTAIEKAMWKHCSIHNVDYPANESCPECDKARNR
jgi:hypothetical protein